MMKGKYVFKPWFAWNPERIEDYLEDMALKGWHVKWVTGLQMLFHFSPGESKHVRYCVDYQVRAAPEYLALAEDDGWKLLDSSVGWLLWRKAYDGERPHLYTDKQSLIERNKRIINLVFICLTAQIPMIATKAYERVTKEYLAGWETGKEILVYAYAAMIAFLVYGVVRLALANRKMMEECVG